MILLVINTVMCTIILAYAINGLVVMSRHTRHAIRLAYVAMAVGAFGVLLRLVMGYYDIPEPSEVFMHVGIAAMFAATRRRRERHAPPLATEGGSRYYDRRSDRRSTAYIRSERRAVG